MGAIIANYFEIFFYAVSAYGGWVMIARRAAILVGFSLSMVAKRPRLVRVKGYELESKSNEIPTDSCQGWGCG